VTVIPERRGDKWTPPPWHAPAPADETTRTPSSTRAGRASARQTQSVRTSDAVRPVVLGYAIAPAATGVLALLLAFAGPLSGSGSVPAGLLILCVLQVVCYVLTRNGDAVVLARSWLLALVMTAGLLPLLTVQASLLQEPWIDADRGSATPALISTFVVVLLVVVVAVWCLAAFSSLAEIGVIAYMPLALIVPGVLGIGSTIDQRAALVAVAESSLLAAGATVLAWSLPRNSRLLVPPAALVVQIVALWLAGRGPSYPESSGGVVSFLYWLTIVVTVALVVVLPAASAWLRRTIAAVEEADRPRQSPSGEGESQG
jgi:hypothetical protein